MIYNSRSEQKNDAGTNKNTPAFFSVIITTFNRAELIERALDSLLYQTEKDWEAIIIDDGSNDDTYLRVLPYMKMCINLTYIRQPHEGKNAAKNNGIWAATGRYITFLDSDDEFHHGHLALRKKLLLNNPSVKFLYGGTRILGEQYVPDRFDYGIKVSLKDCVIGGTFFIERNTARMLHGFRDLIIGGDADLFDRARKNHIEMLAAGEPTYIYHHETEDSVTNRLASAMAGRRDSAAVNDES